MSTPNCSVNKSGYQVTIKVDDGYRSYGVTGWNALSALIFYLTGRDAQTFPQDDQGTPKVPGLRIAYPFHIWGA